MHEDPTRPRLDREDVRRFYNLLPRVYESSDRWHSSTRQWIRQFIAKHQNRISLNASARVLNAGSGGEDCGFPEEFVYHLDLAEQRLKKTARAFVGDLHEPPFEDEFFDVSVCVGSVLNYCDAATAMRALHRVTRRNGFLILEFETSWSLDYCFMPGFMKSAALVTTFYGNHKVRLWAYSEAYVCAVLRANHFETLAQSRAHIFSPLVYKLTKNANRAAQFARLDPFLSKTPILRRFCSNVIFFCRKT